MDTLVIETAFCKGCWATLSVWVLCVTLTFKHSFEKINSLFFVSLNYLQRFLNFKERKYARTRYLLFLACLQVYKYLCTLNFKCWVVKHYLIVVWIKKNWSFWLIFKTIFTDDWITNLFAFLFLLNPCWKTAVLVLIKSISAN